MNCLLAPVPAVHLPDSLEIAGSGGVVAFGSNSLGVLRRLKDEGAAGSLPVYIVVSKTGFDAKKPAQQGLKPFKVQFRGVLTAILEVKTGKHPDPTKRPASALEGDDRWGFFWEVADLAEIKPHLELQDFSDGSGKAWKQTPEGPVPAHLGDFK